MNLKEKIERARVEAKEREAKRPPEPTLKVKGFWQKKSGDRETHSSFVARVTGIGYDQENDRETLNLDFKDLYSEIEWTSKKGSTPEGIKTCFAGGNLQSEALCLPIAKRTGLEAVCSRGR